MGLTKEQYLECAKCLNEGVQTKHCIYANCERLNAVKQRKFLKETNYLFDDKELDGDD